MLRVHLWRNLITAMKCSNIMFFFECWNQTVLKSSCIPEVNRVIHNAQTESLWGGGRWGLELGAEHTQVYPDRFMRWHDTSLSRTPGTSTLPVSPASCQLQEQTTVNSQLCQNQEEDGRFLGKNYFRLERSARLSIAGRKCDHVQT